MDWNLWFYVPFLATVVVGGVILMLVKKGDDVLFVNDLHSPFLDYLFYYGTTLGNGWLYLLVVLALLWRNLSHALIAFLCFSITGISVQLLKRLVFNEAMRPSVLISNESLHFVEGVKILKLFSMPSGHTAMAFSLFCLLSQFIRFRIVGLLFILMAMIGGISRIYLVQHFFVDVYFGAILGVGVTSLVVFISKIYSSPKEKALFS